MSEDTPAYGLYTPKVFFEAGDKVRLKQFSEPEMIVKAVLKIKDPEQNKSQLLGISCMWFTTHGQYQEQTFSTKDLLKLNGVRESSASGAE